jgi:hypothetical protein
MEVDWKLATEAFAIGGAFDTETGIASLGLGLIG